MTNVHSLRHAQQREEQPPEGTRRIIEGEERVFYDGYWIKTYPIPVDSLGAKKRLIEALTRRLFNHTEHGLNIPGSRLSDARMSYQSEVDPGRRRVKAAMLAGALFNRATDIFRKLVELQAEGEATRLIFARPQTGAFAPAVAIDGGARANPMLGRAAP